MKFTRTEINDVVIIEPKVHGDDRGYFVETFVSNKLEEVTSHFLPKIYPLRQAAT